MSLSPLDDTAVTREYTAGTTIRDLAKLYGCSQQAIYERLVAAGVAQQPRSFRRLTPRERRSILFAYRAGRPMADIAAKYGVAVDSIRQVAAKAGGPRRPNGGPRDLDYRRIHKLAVEGKSPEEIAAEVGSTTRWIKILVRELRTAPPARLRSVPRKGVRKRQNPRGRLLNLDMKAMAAQYAAGMLLSEIARTHRCSVPLVCQRLRQAGIQPNRKGKPRISNPDEVVAAYTAGWAVLDICATFGVQKGAPGKLAAKAGVKRRPSGAPRAYDWDDITRRADAGQSSKEIAAEVGCTTRSVPRVLGKRGYTWNGLRWVPPVAVAATPKT